MQHGHGYDSSSCQQNPGCGSLTVLKDTSQRVLVPSCQSASRLTQAPLHTQGRLQGTGWNV